MAILGRASKRPTAGVDPEEHPPAVREAKQARSRRDAVALGKHLVRQPPVGSAFCSVEVSELRAPTGARGLGQRVGREELGVTVLGVLGVAAALRSAWTNARKRTRTSGRGGGEVDPMGGTTGSLFMIGRRVSEVDPMGGTTGWLFMIGRRVGSVVVDGADPAPIKPPVPKSGSTSTQTARKHGHPTLPPKRIAVPAPTTPTNGALCVLHGQPTRKLEFVANLISSCSSCPYVPHGLAGRF